MDMTDDEPREPEAPLPTPPWRVEQTEGLPSASKVSPRRRVLVGVLTFLTAGLIVYGGLLWLRPLPRPVLFTWAADNYPQLPFGAVPFAAQDQAAFNEASWFTQKSLQLPLLAEAGPSETIVVSLKGRAVCDGNGRVFLLDVDAEPASAKGALPLRKILLALAESPARHRFVIIDLFWPMGDPYLADLAHDLPGRIAAELDAIPDARRLVLLSCQTGQLPLASPDLGRTVFGHYLDEGLRGWADTDDAPSDDRGQVTARRLAQFVQARVDRWARLNRDTRQTPLLIGDAADFPLVAYAKGQPQDHREIAAASTYPAWLSAGWKTREQWRRDDRLRVAAWLCRQLDTVLLQAERDWAIGVDEKKTQDILRMEIDRLEKTYAPIAAAARPEPQSLAQIPLAADPKLVKALEDLVKKLDEAQRKNPKAEDAEKAAAKILDDVAPLLKTQTDLALSLAIFAAAVQDPFPRRNTLQLYDRFLSERDPEPRYEETLMIRRLADMAQGMRDEQWPVRSVRKVLELTRRATLAQSRAQASHGLRDNADAAAQMRHDADVLFFSRGFAPLAEAERTIEEALAAYDLLLARQETLERAQRAFDEALDELPWLARWIDADDAAWLQAVQAADELATLLEPLFDARTPRLSLDEIGQKSQELRGLLKTLQQPFAAATLDDLIKQAKGPDGAGSQYVALEANFLVPWAGAERRAELWATCRDLGVRLAKKTADQDLDDKQKSPESAARLGDAERLSRQEGVRVAERFRRGLALLQLAAAKANQLEALRKQAAEAFPADSADPPPALHGVAESLRQSWTQFLPTQWTGEVRPAPRERMARVWPGWLRPLNMTNGLVQATAAPRRQAQTQQWGWLGDLFRFESRDPDAPAFFARAAFALRDFTPPPGPHIVLPAKATPVEINPAKPSLTTDIPVQFLGFPFPGPIDASAILADDEWLRVTLDKTRLEPPDPKTATANVVPLGVTVTLQPGAELSTAPRPLGFLVRVQNGLRSSFHRVTLPYLPNPERVELILSSNPQQPATPLADLRLRPSKGKQTFYLFVRNGTDKARNLQVELRVNKQLVPGGVVAVAVAPRQTSRIPFPGLPKDKLPKREKDEPLASSELPLLDGPLQLRVVDKDSNEVLSDREVKVTQASPREYVRVPSIRFEPAGPDRPKNKLELTVRGGAALTGPPCVVELVLPKKRIPGLKAVRDGVFRGELRSPGDEIKLYASDLEFEPGSDEDGVCTLTIDGIPRAIVFRVTYARFGEPTTPREDDRPSLRVISERYFRTDGPWQGVIEVDNPPTGAKLDVGLGRYSDAAFEAELRHAQLPARQQGIGFAVRPSDGGLEFEPFTGDWVVGFEQVAIRGERIVHARLLADKGQDVVPPVDHTVIFDNQPPEKVAFIDLPKRAQLGQNLLVKATGQDKGVGIREVIFFLGAPGEDKKIPAGAVTTNGDLVPGKDDVWAGKLQLPSDKKGSIPIGVQFINRVGLTAFAKGTVELVDFDPVKNEPGSIQGNVVEGEIPQPGLMVVLLDAKGNKLAEKKSGAEGAFAFEKLPPGKYTVVSEKPAASTRRRAVSAVTLDPGQTARIRLSLKL